MCSLVVETPGMIGCGADSALNLFRLWYFSNSKSYIYWEHFEGSYGTQKPLSSKTERFLLVCACCAVQADGHVYHVGYNDVLQRCVDLHLERDSLHGLILLFVDAFVYPKVVSARYYR